MTGLDALLSTTSVTIDACLIWFFLPACFHACGRNLKFQMVALTMFWWFYCSKWCKTVNRKLKMYSFLLETYNKFFITWVYLYGLWQCNILYIVIWFEILLSTCWCNTSWFITTLKPHPSFILDARHTLFLSINLTPNL